MIQIEYLALVLTGLGLTASILYYAMVLKNANKTQKLTLESRNLQLFMQMYQEMSTPENLKRWSDLMNFEWDDFDDYMRKYSLEANEEAYLKRSSVLRRYNTMGLLVRDNHLDSELLYDYVGDQVLMMWEKQGPFLVEYRVRYGRPELLQWFDYLADEMRKVKLKRGFTIPKWPLEEVTSN